MNRIRWYGPTLLVLGTLLAIMITGPRLTQRLAHAYETKQITLVKGELNADPSLEAMSDSFRKIARAVEPSVVHINVSARRERAAGRAPMGEDFFRRFFGPGTPGNPGNPQNPGDPNAPEGAPRRNPRNQRQQPQQPQQQDPQDRDNYEDYNAPNMYGNGSGWVYDNKGHIVTNNHVVEGADVIRVRFHNGSEREAKVLGTDPKTDVAVLIVEGDDLHPATLADQPVEQGDIVFAFGSPFRFDFSMSMGIVSALGRELGIIHDRSGIAGYERFIQTDAAINPGNSGGPLTNVRGEVVGMNTAIASQTGAFNGLGFAIPVDIAKAVVDQLISKGKVTRGYLGIQLAEELDPDMAKTFGFKGKGVLVDGTMEGTPAAKAGIKAGDIITKVDGQPVTSQTDLRIRVANVAPGTVVKLEVFREGKTMDMTVTAAEQPESVAMGPGRGTEDAKLPEIGKGVDNLRKLGIEQVAALTPEIANQLRLTKVEGVVIESLRPGSVAAVRGLRPGTVIVEVGSEKVNSPDELSKIFEKVDLNQGVRLRVTQEGVTRFVLLKLSE